MRGQKIESPGPAPLPLACAPARQSASPKTAQSAISHSIVRIHAYSREYNILRPFQQSGISRGVGSGVVIPPEALLGAQRASESSPSTLYILTCEHVVRNAHEVMLVFPMHGREEHPARLYALCMETDLAIVECTCSDSVIKDADIRPLPLGSSDELEPGDRVRAFGFPLGQNALKVTDGVYSGYQDGTLQHSSPISKGNSGGPLMNARSQVVGVNSSGVTSAAANNVGYAVPTHMVAVLLRDIRGHPDFLAEKVRPLVIRRHSLGLHVHSTTPATLKYLGAQGCAAPGGGVRVRFLYDDSPLAPHLQPGDLVVGIDNHAIDYKGDVCVPWNRQKVDLRDFLERKSNNDTMDLQVWNRREGCHVLAGTAQRYVHKEGFHYLVLPYEINEMEYALVAGMVITPLRANHESFFPVIFAELGMQAMQRPHLVMTDIIPGTMAYKSEVMRPGKLVSRVNGKCVRTMADLYAALSEPEIRHGAAFLTVQMQKQKRVVFEVEEVLREQEEKTRGPHPLWPLNLTENIKPVALLRDGLARHRGAAAPRPRGAPSSAASRPSPEELAFLIQKLESELQQGGAAEPRLHLESVMDRNVT